MSEKILKKIGAIISNRHLDNQMEPLQVAKIRLLNQYTCILFTLFIINFLWQLFFEKQTIQTWLFFAVGCLLFLLSRYTKLYTHPMISKIIWITVTLIICYSYLSLGFHNVIPYYFAVLFASFFIFTDKNGLYPVFVFLGISVSLYLILLFTSPYFVRIDQPASSAQYPYFTFLQIIILASINGYFITERTKKIQVTYKQLIDTLSQPIPTKIEHIQDPTSLLSIESLTKLVKENDPAFLLAFKQIYPDFHNNLRAQNTEMTKEELKFCALLKFGFTTKEIANYNHLAIRSVQSKKARLRKSFNIPSEQCLYTWIEDF